MNKPGQLDSDEWTIMRTHTIAGQKMLDRVGGFMTEVGRIVRSHHERWDGGGYPDGLAGEDIPLEARIITCCDAWNAMRTDRVYRKALSYEVALTELLCNNGTQFDPDVVAALLRVVAHDAPADAGRSAADPRSARIALGGAPRRSEGAAWSGQSPADDRNRSTITVAERACGLMASGRSAGSVPGAQPNQTASRSAPRSSGAR